MPPKPKFTKEEIVAAGVQITRESGLDAVTSRELGVRLGSSARPIFTVFDNMEELNDQIRIAAKEIYKEYVRKGIREKKAFRGVGAAYIRFAIEEPRLFKILFMRERGNLTNLEKTLVSIEDNYETILQSVQEPNNLNISEAKWLYQHLWVYTHGIATMCATGLCVFTGTEIEKMLTEVFSSLLMKVKSGSIND